MKIDVKGWWRGRLFGKNCPGLLYLLFSLWLLGLAVFVDNKEATLCILSAIAGLFTVDYLIWRTLERKSDD